MFFFNGGGLTDKRTSAGIGGQRKAEKCGQGGGGPKSRKFCGRPFFNGPQSDLSEDDCPDNYYYSSQWDDLSLLPRLQ